MVTLLPILVQCLLDDAFKLRGQPSIDERRYRWLLAQYCVEDHRRGLTAEGLLPRRHFVEHGPEAKDVRARVEFLASSLLRRHVGSGTHRHTRAA